MVEFNNTSEMEEYIQKYLNIPFANLNNIDIKIGNILIDTIEEFFYKYPYFKNCICGIIQKEDVNNHLNLLHYSNKKKFFKGMKYIELNFVNNDMSTVALKLNNIDKVEYLSIILNKILYKTYDELIEILNISVKNGIHPKNCFTIKSFIYHELGHIFDHILNITNNKQFIDIIKDKDIKNNISKYATVDNYEVFAEAFAEYHCSSFKSNALVNQIMNFALEEYNNNKHKTFNLTKKYRY